MKDYSHIMANYVAIELPTDNGHTVKVYNEEAVRAMLNDLANELTNDPAHNPQP